MRVLNLVIPKVKFCNVKNQLKTKKKTFSPTQINSFVHKLSKPLSNQLLRS
jgi:hypothetical protein